MPSWPNRRTILDVAVVLVSLSYPFLVYFGLMQFSPAVVGVALLGLLAVRLLLSRNRGRRKSETGLFIFVLVVMAMLMLVDELLAIKAYPVMVSLAMAALFGYSLFYPPSIIERIARLREPDLDAHGVRYTRNVTLAWVLFFVSNASISSWTALYATLEVWTLYNGFISYILVGVMFTVEFVIRRIVKQRKVSEP
ncbi:MAG: hypothetical protein COB93_08040 [Sneathiella sp.]|nr:MAG: hypothetical protein COB93_08040 [Sneathiella sp.]